MAFRVGDFAKFNSLQLQIQGSQSRLNDLQVQSATGRAGENYAQIADQSNQALRLENSFIKYKRYQDNIKVATQNLDQTDSTLDSLQKTAEKFRGLLLNGLNGNNLDFVALQTQAKDFIQSMQAELNKQIDGKYLYAGTQTATRPVDLTNWGGSLAMPLNLNGAGAYTVPAFPAVPTTFPVTIAANATAEYYGYYEANTNTPSVRADDTLTQSYGITGADPAIAKMFYALRLAATITGAPASEQRDRIQGAYDTISTVIGDMADLRATTGSQNSTLTDISKKHETLLGNVEDLVQNIQSVDITQTMAKLSAEQTQLQASYMTISRLNQVSLVNFLK